MSKVEFNINDWRKKHVLIEGVGGVVSTNPFAELKGAFRTEAVDHIDDKEAAQDYDELEDKDIDNDGDEDKSDEYLHHKLGNVAKRTDEEFSIREWQKKFYGNKRNLKWG